MYNGESHGEIRQIILLLFIVFWMCISNEHSVFIVLKEFPVHFNPNTVLSLLPERIQWTNISSNRPVVGWNNEMIGKN